jgi:hypothetical protein
MPIIWFAIFLCNFSFNYVKNQFHRHYHGLFGALVFLFITHIIIFDLQFLYYR